MKKTHLKKAAQLTLSLSLAFQPLVGTIALADERKDQVEISTVDGKEENIESKDSEKSEESTTEKTEDTVSETAETEILPPVIEEGANSTNEGNTIEENNTKDSQSAENQKEDEVKTRSIMSGTYGTAPWSFDDTTGVLEISEGAFPSGNGSSLAPSPWIPLLQAVGTSIDKVKEIVISGDVVLASNSVGVFSGFTNVTAIKNAGRINTSNVTQFSSMFKDNEKLIELDVSNWDVSNGDNAAFMFRDVKSLENLDVSNWSTGNFRGLGGMFQDASSLKELNVTNWDTSSVKSLEETFKNTTSLEKLDVSNWTTTSFENIRAAFSGAASLTELNVSNWNVGALYALDHVFENMTSLQSIDVSQWNTERVTDFAYMFSGSSSLKTLDLSNWKTKNGNRFLYMFANMTSLESLMVADWDTSNGSDMNAMFLNDVNLKTIDVSKWNVSQAITLASIFQNVSKLESLDISTWNTGRVLNFANAFAGMSALEELDVSNLDVSKATDIQAMFSGMTAVKKLDVSGWETGNVEFMYRVFEGTSTVSELDLSNWTVGDKVYNMFDGMSSLHVLKLGKKVSTIDGSGLPEVKAQGVYNGKWQAVGKGTVEDPQGLSYSAATLMDRYRPLLADTYVWAVRKPTILAKNSEIYVGDSWDGKDNFVLATSAEGTLVSYDPSMVSGTVDTTTPGAYKITYTNGTAQMEITVKVIENQETIKAKDSVLYVGDTWNPEDNFVSATDKDGNPVLFDASMVAGTVDTTKAGTYKVTYTNGKQTAEATIEVRADQTSIMAEGSTLTVGDTWNPEDNFVSATDRDGNDVPFTDITVTGTVDTSKVGEYEVTYTNGTVSQTVIIKVIDKVIEKSNLTIQHRDTNGQTLSGYPDEVRSEEIGTAYKVTPATIKGFHWIKTEVTPLQKAETKAMEEVSDYVVDEKTGEVTGVYTEESVEIRFVYEKDKETPKPPVEPGKPEPGKPEPVKPSPTTPTNPNTTKPSMTKPTPTSPSSKLPQTGEVKSALGIIGIGVVLAGAVLVFVTNRNKKKTDED